MPRLRAATLIVSDTAFSDPSTDRAGEALTDTFSTEGGDQWDVFDPKIVKDDIDAIQHQICAWSDGPEPVNLILTTGGTGFSVKDDTPEAVGPLIHKHAPGLV